MSDFQFIAVRGPRKSADPATRKAVRQHVARQHGKKRRLEDVKKYRSLALAGAGTEHSWRAGRTCYRSPESIESSNAASLVSSPNSLLDASLCDHFSVFPIPMQRVDLELVDFWSTDLARTRWGPDLGESYRPMRDLFFAQAVEHEASLHGMLFLSASWMSRWRPPKAATSQVVALHHRQKLLQQINGAFSRGDFAMPGLLQGIGFQIVYEGVLGNYHSCRRHLVGMRSIVLAIGGLEALSDQPRVQMIFIYLSFDTAPDYLPLPVVRQTQTHPTTVGESIPQMVYSSPKELMEVNAFINDTITFLQRIQTLSLGGWVLHIPSDINPFGPTTIFYHILSPRWLPPFEFSAPASQSQPKGVLGQHRTTRMACLLLLCEALLALLAPSRACDEYMIQQADLILIERADEKPDLRSFLHLLMKDHKGVRLRDVSVALRASRIAQVVKRLSVQTCDRVGELLLGCLAGEKGVAEGFGERDWRRVREEAFAFGPP